MTVLNFAITPDGIFVLMDSLVTQDDEPAFFTSKAMPVPHLNGIICGTGLQKVFHLWSLRVLGGMVAFDLPDLDQFATDSLRDVWSELPEEERQAGTSTIYHFGYDSASDEFLGYAYRSTNDFESEQLMHGVATKPPYAGDLPMGGFPDDFVEVCRTQRIEQQSVALGERVHIGGQLAAYMMLRNHREGKAPSVAITIETAFEFEDYEDMFASCVERLQRMQ